MSGTPPAFLGALEAARRLLEAGAGEAELYSHWFHGVTQEVSEWPSATIYLAALVGSTRFEPGWRVVEPAPGWRGAVTVERDGRLRVVAPPSVAPAAVSGLGLSAGTEVLVDPLASGEADGFWHVWSAGWQRDAPPTIDRVYCAIRPERAADAVSCVARLAPPDGTWSAKALLGVHHDGRRDGLMLYLPRETALARGWVGDVVRMVAVWCRAEVPPFVEPLAAGVGWAPDPGDGRSFGQAVSAAVASARSHADDPERFTSSAWQAIRALPGLTTPTSS